MGGAECCLTLHTHENEGIGLLAMLNEAKQIAGQLIQVQAMYGPWPTNLLGHSCKYYCLFNIYKLFYIQFRFHVPNLSQIG